jgi:DNA-binding HxlR family transcriptional regulator
MPETLTLSNKCGECGVNWAELLQDKSSLTAALDLLGDKWTLMIISGSMANLHRFNQLEKSLGINRNLLASRLKKLVAAGLIEKTVYHEKPTRYEYRVTEIGLQLRPVIIGLALWSEHNLTTEGVPIGTVHKGCGGRVSLNIRCDKCDETVDDFHIGSSS